MFRYSLHHVTRLRGLLPGIWQGGQIWNASPCSTILQIPRPFKILNAHCKIEDPAKRAHKVISLNNMVGYCLTSGCRRELLLKYFGCDSAKPVCQKQCDNCMDTRHTDTRDVTTDAVTVLRCLIEMKEKVPKISCRLLQQTFRGSKQKDVTNKGFDSIQHFGCGKERYNEKKAVKFIHEMVVRDILQETIREGNEPGSSTHLALGPRAQELLDGKLAVQVTIRK